MASSASGLKYGEGRSERRSGGGLTASCALIAAVLMTCSGAVSTPVLVTPGQSVAIATPDRASDDAFVGVVRRIPQDDTLWLAGSGICVASVDAVYEAGGGRVAPQQVAVGDTVRIELRRGAEPRATRIAPAGEVASVLARTSQS